MPNSAIEFFTTVVCVSYKREYFDWLPPVGLYLNPQQEFKYAGTIFDWLRVRTNGHINQNDVLAMKHSFDNGLLEIRESPNPVFYDAVLEQTRVMNIVDGDIRISDPDGGSGATVTPTPEPTTPEPTTGA